MNTSIIGVALTAALFPAHMALTPAWYNDYRQARELGSRENKPLVVVIGSGKTPWANLARVAEQDGSINQTLRSSYVCVFVDTDTTEGQRVAQTFEMSGPGMVISDRSGAYQAYRRAGELPASELARELINHTNDTYVAQKLAPPAVQPVAYAAPVVQPASYAAPVYYPAVFGGFSSFGGSCSSCRR
jgi:hypothetical protein